MKKILIVINNLNCGGIQKALIELLKLLPQQYEVTLRCFSCKGILMSEIPNNVKILPENTELNILAESMQELKKKSNVLFIKKAVWALVAKIFGAPIMHRFFFKNIVEKGKYDIAISYTQDVSGYSFSVGCNDYVLMCVNAKRKFTFIHCDFSAYGGNDKINRSRYHFFDKIICVSASCKKRFDQCCPECKEKSFVLKNSLDDKDVLRLANIDPFIYDCKCINFITVARLSHEKGILRALKAMKVVIKKHTDIRWYVVGNGPEYVQISDYIKSNHLEKYVILLGEQSNPYKYMKNADCLLVPSYHECAPMVFKEASILHLPILTTNTLSAVELVKEKGIGWVCDNTDEGLLVGLNKVVDLLKTKQYTLNYTGNTDDTLIQFGHIVEDIKYEQNTCSC